MREGRAAQATLFHRVPLPQGVGGKEVEAAEKGRGGGDVGEGQVRGHVLLVSGLGFVPGLPVRPPGACGCGPHRRQSWGGDPRLMALSLWRCRHWEREAVALGNEAGVPSPFPDQLTKTRWRRAENPTSAPGLSWAALTLGPQRQAAPTSSPPQTPPALRCLGPPPPHQTGTGDQEWGPRDFCCHTGRVDAGKQGGRQALRGARWVSQAPPSSPGGARSYGLLLRPSPGPLAREMKEPVPEVLSEVCKWPLL